MEQNQTAMTLLLRRGRGEEKKQQLRGQHCSQTTQEVSAKYCTGGILGLGTTKHFLEYLYISRERERDTWPKTIVPGTFHDDDNSSENKTFLTKMTSKAEYIM